MISNLYKWFWFNTQVWIKKPEDRRPYTYLIRDFYHRQPLLFILLSGIFFYCLGRWWWQVSLAVFLMIVVALLIGVILGHLFWGKKHIEGQQEYPTYLGEVK